MSLKGYYLVSRPLNSFYSGFAVLIGAIAAISNPLTEIQIINIFLGYLTTAFIAAGGYAINDAYDVEIDKINMPHRAIPSGLITPKQAMIYAVILYMLGILMALIIDILACIIAGIGAFLLFLYAAYFKRTGFVGNLLVSILTAIPFIFGGIITESYETLIYPALFAFLLILGREVIKDIEDVRGDKLENVQSLALRYGVKPARNMAILTLLLLVLLVPIPVILGYYKTPFFFGTLLLIGLGLFYTIFLLLRRTDEEIIKNTTSAKRILKSCIGIGILGFVLEGLTKILYL